MEHVSDLLSHCLKPKSRFIIPSFFSPSPFSATMQRFPREECSLVANCQNCPDVTSSSRLKRSSANEKLSFPGNFLRLHLRDPHMVSGTQTDDVSCKLNFFFSPKQPIFPLLLLFPLVSHQEVIEGNKSEEGNYNRRFVPAI